MFLSLHWSGRNDEHEYDTFDIVGTCLDSFTATTPFSSPSLKYDKHRVSNSLTVYSLFKLYETHNLNVALNLAAYYNWLVTNMYYQADVQFIAKQIKLIDNALLTKLHARYYHNICFYLNKKFGW